MLTKLRATRAFNSSTTPKSQANTGTNSISCRSIPVGVLAEVCHLRQLILPFKCTIKSRREIYVLLRGPIVRHPMANQCRVIHWVDAVMHQFIAVIHVHDQRQCVRLIQSIPMNSYTRCGGEVNLNAMVQQVYSVMSGMRCF